MNDTVFYVVYDLGRLECDICAYFEPCNGNVSEMSTFLVPPCGVSPLHDGSDLGSVCMTYESREPLPSGLIA